MIKYRMKLRQFEIDLLVKVNRVLISRTDYFKRRLDKLIDAQLEARRKLKIQELPPGGYVIWESHE